VMHKYYQRLFHSIVIDSGHISSQISHSDSRFWLIYFFVVDLSRAKLDDKEKKSNSSDLFVASKTRASAVEPKFPLKTNQLNDEFSANKRLRKRGLQFATVDREVGVTEQCGDLVPLVRTPHCAAHPH
jgi:hypothetical protein